MEQMHKSSGDVTTHHMFKVWMIKSWRDSFVGSTLRGSFESSISGDKLKDLIDRARQADNAFMHATFAADHAKNVQLLCKPIRRA